jgi:predicted phosphodiesterase
LSNYKYYCFNNVVLDNSANNFEFFIEDFYIVKGDNDNDVEAPLENYLLRSESDSASAHSSWFFLAVALLTGQRKLKKLGSEQKKEQSTIVLVI